MSKSSKTGKPPEGAERRKSKRLDVLETFSLFVVVPAKGPLRLKVNDISKDGIGFDLDIEDERGAGYFETKVGAGFEVQLYLNQTLYIPLSVSLKRITDVEGIRRVGCEISGKPSAGHTALKSFLDMLDAVSEAGHIA